MRLCLFCKQPIKFDDTGQQLWEYEGLQLPCHAMCGDWMAASIRNYEPIDTSFANPTPTPKVWGWVGVTFQQYRFNWESLSEKDKAFYFDRYQKILERTLDHQTHEVKAYCKRAGLPEPEIVRELKQSNRMLTEMRHILTHRACPGDHLVVPQFPRQRRADLAGATKYVRQLARRAARGGVTLHMAYLCLDWSKPISQAAVNLAVATSTWTNDIREANTGYERGIIERLYGIRWEDLKHNKLFIWIVQCIRDQKMTPIEVGQSSKKFWTVIGWTGKRSVVIMMTRDRKEAMRHASLDYFWCRKCRLATSIQACPKCHQHGMSIKVGYIKGAAFSARLTGKKQPFEETAAACWAFYCQQNPSQEKLPWMTRSRLP